MDQVWFKLRETNHHPPGPEEVILAGNGDDSRAPLGLGHCIADLNHLDNPINSGVVVAFPPEIRVIRAPSIDLNWDRPHSFDTAVALAAANERKIPGLGVLSIEASVSLAFKRTVSQHEFYNRLDTYLVEPRRTYVEQVLKTPKIKGHIAKDDNWSFFMITGIRVARLGDQL